MATYNIEHSVPAYHCGGLMAIYATIQSRSVYQDREQTEDKGQQQDNEKQKIKVGVIQRYYASASRTPALVLSQLNRLSNYHLDKLENSYFFEQQLAELYTALGDTVPVTLNLEEQSYFALGYYQKWAELHPAKKKKSETAEDSNEDMSEESDKNMEE